MTQAPKEEILRDLKLAKIAIEFRKSLFEVNFDLFRQVLSSCFIISILAGIICGALGISSWLLVLVGWAIATPTTFYVLKLYVRANSEYQLWFQAEAVAEVLQRAKDKSASQWKTKSTE